MKSYDSIEADLRAIRSEGNFPDDDSTKVLNLLLDIVDSELRYRAAGIPREPEVGR